MIRNAGTAVQVSGIEQEISFDMNLFEWDKVYINPLYGKCRPQIDFPNIVELYESGQLLLDEMITRTYSLEELGRSEEHTSELQSLMRISYAVFCLKKKKQKNTNKKSSIET